MSTSVMVTIQELANLKKFLGLPAWAQRKHVYADVVRLTEKKPNNPNVGKVYYMWGRGAFLCFKEHLTSPWTKKAFQKKLNFDEVIPFPDKSTQWERLGKPQPDDVEEESQSLEIPTTPLKRKAPTNPTEPPSKKQKLETIQEEEETYEVPKTPDFENESDQ